MAEFDVRASRRRSKTEFDPCRQMLRKAHRWRGKGRSVRALAFVSREHNPFEGEEAVRSRGEDMCSVGAMHQTQRILGREKDDRVRVASFASDVRIRSKE